MQKDGYPFAAAQRIPDLMKAFDKTVLALQTPCNQMDSERLAEALGISHVEFIVIHPFREGNGRLSRVLATMMALQAGQPPLDFTWMAENKREYFAAIQNGHAGNYEPIKKIFSLVLQSSQRED
jgi:cell filamentation protein